MKINQNTKLRIIHGSLVVHGITRKQATNGMIQGRARIALDYAIKEIEKDSIYRGIASTFDGVSLQVDVID